MNNSNNPISLMYLFAFSVKETTEKKAIKAALPTVKRCELFAESLSITCNSNHVGLIDDELSVRVIFNIKGSQNEVFVKVASLFAFAASVELILTNQTLLTE